MLGSHIDLHLIIAHRMIRQQPRRLPINTPMIKHTASVDLQKLVRKARVSLFVAHPKPVHRIQPINIPIFIIFKPSMRLHHPALVPNPRRQLNHGPYIRNIVTRAVHMIALRVIRLQITPPTQVQHRLFGGIQAYSIMQIANPLRLHPGKFLLHHPLQRIVQLIVAVRHVGRMKLQQMPPILQLLYIFVTLPVIQR